MSVTSSGGRTPASVVNSCGVALDLTEVTAAPRQERHAGAASAERMNEAAVERLDRKHPAMLVHFLVDDARNLKVQARVAKLHSPTFLSPVTGP